MPSFNNGLMLLAIVIQVYWSSLHLSVIYLFHSTFFFPSSSLIEFVGQSLMIINLTGPVNRVDRWEAQSISWFIGKIFCWPAEPFKEDARFTRTGGSWGSISIYATAFGKLCFFWWGQAFMRNFRDSHFVFSFKLFFTFPLIVLVQGFARWMLAED